MTKPEAAQHADKPAADATFSERNRRRCESPSGFNHALSSWSLSDWMTATIGEVGEAANVVKKLNRVRDGIPGNRESEAELRGMLADEIADAAIYLDLLAQAAGFDLNTIRDAKFQKTSDKIGYSEPATDVSATDDERRAAAAASISDKDLEFMAGLEIGRLQAWLLAHESLWQYMSGSPVDVAIAIMSQTARATPPSGEVERRPREVSAAAQEPVCPQCSKPLQRVPGKPGWMNADQWDATKAGDWYCETCPDNGRGISGLCYWRDSEVRTRLPREVSPAQQYLRTLPAAKAGQSIEEAAAEEIRRLREDRDADEALRRDMLAASKRLGIKWGDGDAQFLNAMVKEVETLRQYKAASDSTLACIDAHLEQAGGVMYVSNRGEVIDKLAADRAALTAERADISRILEWWYGDSPKPPELAFTEGPERQIADLLWFEKLRAEAAEGDWQDAAAERDALAERERVARDALEAAHTWMGYAFRYCDSTIRDMYDEVLPKVSSAISALSPSPPQEDATSGDYPNIEACRDGRTSGRLNEWPVLRQECGQVLAELAKLRERLAEVERQLLCERNCVKTYMDAASYWWAAWYDAKGLEAPMPRSSDPEQNRVARDMIAERAELATARREAEAAKGALLEDPDKWSFDTLVTIAGLILERDYRADVFTGASGDAGARFVAAFRDVLATPSPERDAT